MTKSGWKRSQNESWVYIAHMIGDHQQRTFDPTEVFSALDARPAQQYDRRPQKEIVGQQSYPGHRPAQRPGRIVVWDGRFDFSAQHAFQVTDSADSGEASFAEVQLVTVLQRAEEFYAIERTQAEIGIEAGFLR